METMAREDGESMARYILVLGGTMAGILLVIALVFMFFTNLGARYGIGGALLGLGAVLLAFGWYWDRKHARPAVDDRV